MRIAWFTPLAKSSAIGKVAADIAAELAQAADVEIWCSDRGELHAIERPVVRYTVSDAFERVLTNYDAVVYHLGDNYAFHRDIFLMSRRVPGIAVLHDFVMHHFLMGYYLEAPGRVESYFGAMERWYGSAGRAAAQESFARHAGMLFQRPIPLWSTDRVVEYPLFEETIGPALGVVVHSDFLRRHVERAAAVPVRRIYLPAVQNAAAQAPKPREALDVPPGRAILLTVGHVNPNKQVHAVIEALGRNPDLASRTVYVVIGELAEGDYGQRLADQIERHGLRETVRLSGRRSDQELGAWLAHADVCLNLRYPVMEGASASLADQMLSGRAVVVSNAGVYAEIPEDCVRKIAPGREAEELPGVLRELLDDPDARTAMAARGRAYAAARFQAGLYARELLDFVRDLGPVSAMARYADNVAGVMKEMGILPGMPIVAAVARESTDLFGDPVTSPWRPGKSSRG